MLLGPPARQGAVSNITHSLGGLQCVTAALLPSSKPGQVPAIPQELAVCRAFRFGLFGVVAVLHYRATDAFDPRRLFLDGQREPGSSRRLVKTTFPIREGHFYRKLLGRRPTKCSAEADRVATDQFLPIR